MGGTFFHAERIEMKSNYFEGSFGQSFSYSQEGDGDIFRLPHRAIHLVIQQHAWKSICIYLSPGKLSRHRCSLAAVFSFFGMNLSRIFDRICLLSFFAV
mmetsp:Transcript_33906/g.67155  ORF Transcript_33906/g.67155 Transcript_33906/m.67155 type:complete len:99 (-) Transcript_33906:1185-1481(-)